MERKTANLECCGGSLEDLAKGSIRSAPFSVLFSFSAPHSERPKDMHAPEVRSFPDDDGSHPID
jgi:hypothetical protein